MKEFLLWFLNPFVLFEGMPLFLKRTIVIIATPLLIFGLLDLAKETWKISGTFPSKTNSRFINFLLKVLAFILTYMIFVLFFAVMLFLSLKFLLVPSVMLPVHILEWLNIL